jgi:hypothetical protein
LAKCIQFRKYAYLRNCALQRKWENFVAAKLLISYIFENWQYALIFCFSPIFSCEFPLFTILLSFSELVTVLAKTNALSPNLFCKIATRYAATLFLHGRLYCTVVVENLVLYPTGGYRASEVLLPKVATTLADEPLVEQGDPNLL